MPNRSSPLPTRVINVEFTKLDRAQQVLTHVRDVVILLSRDRSIQFANRQAERLLSRRDSLRIHRGRLAAATSADAGRLEQAIDRACLDGHRKAQLMVVRRPDSPPLVLTVRCVADDIGQSILLLGSDPCVDSALVLDSLRQCFGLTVSEAKVAAAVAAGVPTARIAADRGVQVNTIRSQIKSVAAKLGCASRSQISAIVQATSVCAADPY